MLQQQGSRSALQESHPLTAILMSATIVLGVPGLASQLG